MNSNKVTKLTVLLLTTVCVVAFAVAWRNTDVSPTSRSRVKVVAGENFWGSLASQIGGAQIELTTVITDPNADPHEQAASNTNARAFATADYVILNGAGYDSWGNRLLSSGGPADRTVLDIANLLGKKEGDNPHFWYNPAYVNTVINQITRDLSSLSPTNRAYFEAQRTKLLQSVATYQNRITEIAQTYAGTQVAATEDIFKYLATSANLDLVSPAEFMAAVAEGNDPPASSVAEFQQQLESGNVKVLVYNEQTATPLTTNLRAIAQKNHIPIVAITETVQPGGQTFQSWMNNEVYNLLKALQTNE